MTTTTMGFVAETLAWCNDRRREKGMEPLGRLAARTGLRVVAFTQGHLRGQLVPLLGLPVVPVRAVVDVKPEAVALFVQEFDGGALPEYDKHAGEEGEDW